MRKNKIQIPLVALLTATFLLLGGCATLQTNTQRLDEVAAIVKTTTRGTVFLLCKEDKNVVHYCRAVVASLDTFLLEEQVSPNKLKKALEKLPIKELQADYAQLVIVTVVDVYEVFLKQSLREGFEKELVAYKLVTALKNGTQEAIEMYSLQYPE